MANVVQVLERDFQYIHFDDGAGSIPHRKYLAASIWYCHLALIDG